MLICRAARGLGLLSACLVRAAGRGTRGYCRSLIGEAGSSKAARCRTGDSTTGLSIDGLGRLSSSCSGVVSSSVSKAVTPEPAELVDSFLAVFERLSV